MIRRLVSSVILIPPVLAAIWIGAPYFNILLLIAGLAAIFEWCRIAAVGHSGRLGYAALCLFAAVLVLYSFEQYTLAWRVLGLGALILIGFGWRGSGSGNPWPAIGLLYIGAACIALAVLRGDQVEGRHVILWLFLVVWATDIGAYLFGRWIGGARLAPSISPGKTWAGLIGGATSAAVVAAILLAAIPVERGIMAIVALSALVAVVSQAGDLFESWYKRRFGVKDSGNLIPGHGGILDRIDGMLLAAPLVAIIYWLSQGEFAPWI
jgi:phosphatidate cytidylyltransferase